MKRLIVLFFFLPWWAYVPMAGGVGYLGHALYTDALEVQAAREAALTIGAPDRVDLSAFDPARHVGPADEVSLTGWINTDYNYELLSHADGVPGAPRYLYMLFGLGDDAGSRAVRAAIVLTQEEKDRFVATMSDRVLSFRGTDPVLSLGGFAKSGDFMSGLVSQAIAEQGLTKADGFFYLSPFLEGRAVALAADGAAEKQRMQVWLVAAALALLGLTKKFTKPGRAATASRKTRARIQVQGGANKKMDTEDMLTTETPDAPLSRTIAPDSPLGRLAARTAPAAAPAPVVEDETPVAPVMARAQTRTEPPAGRFSSNRCILALGLAAGFAVNAVFAENSAAVIPVPFVDGMVIDSARALIGLSVLFGVLAVIFALSRRAPAADGARVEPPLQAEPVLHPGEGIARHLSAGRPWARSTDAGDFNAPHAVNCDMRDRMRADPYDRLAQQTRFRR
ncbi:hypothetical protein GQE99_20855 [Maritimibacter sp. DP07]|uniref:Uncharacterized protein n=1 Tax=Maritimibacter harenae TaxID=2606218 RepID=A0A845M943_9RHOB|nr:hypothetical protein [Maritimibacter harenae]